ncbi:hypothetical protein AC792_06140 [Arthrobacter sp. RIT-PI-e]|uniref:DUF5997 family protein n=1 Tax=Arthrobacter sp. RIT-PI-e TaxID=1681197 RepID=UPI000676318B|nr:DUF5997 family protein [Arthrobacter sp. RIT-PI-e]KNC19433.1 hypothetical protein AC792_06140 [Arthrobacter sp. RIT-PI-e]
MTPAKTPQTPKPPPAANKRGIYLPATPQDFQDTELTRAEFDALQQSAPEWLAELRRTGPHPRPVVAQKLGVSIGGLARGGVTEPLTTEQITTLLQDPPAWLVSERATQAAVRAEATRVKQRDATRGSADA